jgi:hypothetical protein
MTFENLLTFFINLFLKKGIAPCRKRESWVRFYSNYPSRGDSLLGLLSHYDLALFINLFMFSPRVIEAYVQTSIKYRNLWLGCWRYYLRQQNITAFLSDTICKKAHAIKIFTTVLDSFSQLNRPVSGLFQIHQDWTKGIYGLGGHGCYVI